MSQGRQRRSSLSSTAGSAPLRGPPDAVTEDCECERSG
jgi:hypothetical protein